MIEGAHLSMQKWSMDTPIESTSFDTHSFWVQIKGMPLSVANVRAAAGRIDWKSDSYTSLIRNPRVLVCLDSKNPLCPGFIF